MQSHCKNAWIFSIFARIIGGCALTDLSVYVGRAVVEKNNDSIADEFVMQLLLLVVLFASVYHCQTIVW